MIISGNCIDECAHNLNRYIRYNLKPYQVVLLNSEYKSTKHIISIILEAIPYTSIDINKMSTQDLRKSIKRPYFGTPRDTSLFILMLSQNGTSISSSLEYLRSLSPANVRPRTLLIYPSNRKLSFEKFLRERWLNQFLDFTILEIEPKIPLILNTNIQRVHYYNPFTNSYVRKKCSLIKNWFPNKLLNLNGYLIKGGLHIKPPFSLPKYDEEGKLKSYSGADVEMFRCMSEVMNFTTYIDSDVDSVIGTVRGNQTTGMLNKLSYNRVNLVITTTVNFRPSDGALYGYSTSLEMEAIIPLIPISVSEIKEDYLNLKALYFRMVLFAGFVILMFALIGNSYQNYWKPEYITAILLGVTLPRQPSAVCHRILFLYFIAIGFCTSCTFLGDLTASKVIFSNDSTMETFKQLAQSNLTPVIDPIIHHYLENDGGDLEILKKRMIPSEFTETTCISTMINHRNVTCVIMHAYAKKLESLLRDSFGHPMTKMLKEKLYNVRRIIVLERSTPYRPRFDQLVNIFIVSGLRMKWENNVSNDKFILELFNISKHDDEEFLEINDLGAVLKLGMILFLVVLPGYLLSVSFFLGELWLDRCLKRNDVEIFQG